jgi:DNA repair and recombination protein RAD54B
VRIAAKPWNTNGNLNIGDALKMGNKDVEVSPAFHSSDTQIDSILAKADYLSGKSFISTTSISTSSAAPKAFVPPSSNNSIPIFRTALTKPKSKEPRHDPRAPEAIVLTRPKIQSGATPIDVVIDPQLSRHLRAHQKEGVKFLYKCIMGMNEYQGQGAVLADEMGLGKTLTVITLIWTLLSYSHWFRLI